MSRRLLVAAVFLTAVPGALRPARAEPTSCDPATVGELMMDLFPPAEPDTRAKAARALATCGHPRAVGAIAAVLKSDPATEVRIAAAAGLASVGTDDAKAVLVEAAEQRANPFAVRAEALKSLAAVHETKVLEARLSDAHDDPDLRAQALLLLEKSGHPVAAETVARLANGRPTGLSAVATAVLVQRQAEEAKARIAALAPVPETKSPEPAPQVAVEVAPAVEQPVDEIAPAEVVVVKPAEAVTAPEPAAEPIAEKTEEKPAEPEPAAEPAAIAEAEPATPTTEPAPNPAVIPELTPPSLTIPPKEPDFRILPPPGPADGSSLAIGTSSVAGAALMASLSMLGQQDSGGVLLLTGTAGALIGGFTSGVLWRHPTLSQSAWYLNSTAWGTLAGLTIWAGSGVESEKLKWGSLVVGEAVGIGAGLWSANKYEWTPEMMILADSLVLSAGLANAGVRGMRGLPLGVSQLAAIGVVPVMVGSTFAARAIDPSEADIHLIAKGAALAGWNGMLLSSGGFQGSPFTDGRSRGGLFAGLGAGYLAGVLASPFVEVDPERSSRAVWASIAGNVIGLGANMAATPANANRWALGAGAGGLALATAAFLYHPKLQAGPDAAAMTFAGALYGAGTWLAANRAGWDGSPVTDADRARMWGGALAGGTTAAIAGYVASKHFQPTAEDQWTTAAATVLGASGGLGVAKLGFSGPGGADALGVLGGAALGFAGGAVASHLTELRGPDVGAGFAGLGYGALLGSLAPSLGNDTWRLDRRDGGGALLGMSVAATLATVAAHETQASGGLVALPTVAGIFGLGMGTGAGMLFDRPDTQAIRIGTFAGPLVLSAAALGTDRWLKLSDGLGPSAGSLALATGALGTVEGIFLAQLAAKNGRMENVDSQLLSGGMLLGASAGAAAGLAMSRRLDPPWSAYLFGGAATFAGSLFGKGVAELAVKSESQADPAAMLTGSAAGLVASALLAKTDWTEADAEAATSGAAFGSVLGTLAPSLHLREYEGGRRGEGGAYVGLALGSAGALWAAHATKAAPGQVALATGAGTLGLLAGTGIGMAWPVQHLGLLDEPVYTTQPERLGATVGTVAVTAAALLADEKLKLSEGLGPSAAKMGAFGGLFGTYYGYELAGAIGYEGTTEKTPGDKLAGGALFGLAAGVGTGLALSRAYEPGNREFVLAGGSSVAGAMLGAGVPLLLQNERTRVESIGLTAGGLFGMGLGAYAAHRTHLTGADEWAAAWGGSYGLLAGELLPTIGERTWSSSLRTSGGAYTGIAAGTVAAVLASHLDKADADQVHLAGLGALLGLGTGFGAALAMPTWGDLGGPDTRPQRIATLAGTTLLGAATIAADRKWHFSQGFGPDAVGLGTLGGALGGWWGTLGAAAVSPDGQLSSRDGSAVIGGLLGGSSLGLAAGLATSKFVDLAPGDGWPAIAGPVLGAGLGLGLSMAATDHANRADPLLELAGSASALALAAYTQHASPLEGEDWLAMPLGLSSGLLFGSIAPTLGQKDWPGYDRNTSGWALAGASGGALAAMALRHGTDAEASTVGLATVGGLDGALTGVGLGLLVDPDHSQAGRIAVTASTAAGLALGSAVWPRVHLTGDDAPFLLAATGVGAWTGLWLPAVTSKNFSDVRTSQQMGGLLAGLGGVSMAASLAAPVVGQHPDLVENAVALDAAWSLAGVGAGLLADKGDGVTVSGMLVGGSLGLLAGGAFHDAIDVDGGDKGLLTLAAFEGAWFGGWAPRLVRPADQVTTGQQVGGVLLGAFGGLGAAALATKASEAAPQTLVLSAAGTAIGASMGGGLALVSTGLEGRAATGTMLGASAIGLAGGMLASKYWDLDGSAVPKALVGSLLGTTEGLAFAWAGRASTSDQWGGAALFGLGTGTLLGLTAAAYPHFTTSQLPAAAGCAAWGAWIGSFAGAFAGQDAHEVTMGGLLGANLGFAAGYGLLRNKLIEPSDLGWLSLAAGIGTLVGAGVGAPLSSRNDSRPVLAGLSIGPAVGMIAGGFLLPKLRALGAGGEVGELEVPHLAE